jgi:hypothetical protein
MTLSEGHSSSAGLKAKSDSIDEYITVVSIRSNESDSITVS